MIPESSRDRMSQRHGRTEQEKHRIQCGAQVLPQSSHCSPHPKQVQPAHAHQRRSSQIQSAIPAMKLWVPVANPRSQLRRTARQHYHRKQ